MDNKQTVSFGFEDIKAEEKPTRVHNIFAKVASKYDMMNDVMSFGLHHAWKAQFIKHLLPRHGNLLLDMAGGTGDIALSFLKKLNSNNFKGKAIIADINQHMLEAGKEKNHKFFEKNFNKDGKNKATDFFSYQLMDAQDIPLNDNSVDRYSISFGIRNVTDRAKCLSESFRVLKSGGLFACLEFSKPPSRMIRNYYYYYLKNIIPFMGKNFANNRQAYEYLGQSIIRFPDADNFITELKQAGFSNTSYYLLSGGAAAIHLGWKS